MSSACNFCSFVSGTGVRGLSRHIAKCPGFLELQADEDQRHQHPQHTYHERESRVNRIAQRQRERNRRTELEPQNTVDNSLNDMDWTSGNVAEEPQSPPVQPTIPTAPVFVPPPTKRGRERRFPQKFADFLPNSTTRLPHLPPRPEPVPVPAAPAAQSNNVPPPELPPFEPPNVKYFQTPPNDFGVYRVYPSWPSCEQDDNHDLNNLCDAPGLAVTPSDQESRGWWSSFGIRKRATEKITNIFAPFLNATVYRLINWFYSGGNTKSVAELKRLVDEVLTHKDFDQNHLKDFNVAREFRRLDSEDDSLSPFASESGWKTTSFTLPLPCEQVLHSSEESCPKITIPNLQRRSLVEVIMSAFKDETAKSFHYTPFRQFYNAAPDALPERVVTELYNSDAFYEEHVKLMSAPPDPDSNPNEPQYEKAIAALMFWSDSTHLANFGTASLWPIYLYFGNLSKYARSKPSNFAAHHVAYIPSLPDDLQDIYMRAFNGKAASAETITHLKRELMQAVWMELLDEDFMKAYEHGIVMRCADGIIRRIYPRIFTYSADYPEKVLLSTIRYLATCPCPRCKIKLKYVPGLGTTVDDQRRDHQRLDSDHRQMDIEMARGWIYKDGKGVKSKAVENLLQDLSTTPTRNAFSTRLFKFGFNFYGMFVPDLLHEFELGVWKSVFTHLLRILHAGGGNKIQDLNQRYRLISTFGRSTIRKFHKNASAMSKLAARDFEDLLQCALPVFERLLPPTHNKLVLDMIFVLCTWHALAKLRLHTSTTITGLKATTRSLGASLRTFVKKVCSAYDAKELPGEAAARIRRAASAAKKRGPSTAAPSTTRSGKEKASQPTKSAAGTKILNLFTYKLHALGDYYNAIRQYGPSDGYSTQAGELEHKRVKRFYSRTNKGKTFERQISRHQRRQRLLRRISARIAEPLSSSNTTTSSFKSTAPPPPIQRNPQHTVPVNESDPLPATLPEQRYHISAQRFHRLNLFQWLHENDGDEAFEGFLDDLKDHILSRLIPGCLDFSNDQRNKLTICRDSLYRHKVLRINYTSYDLRRSQDSVNPKTHADVMMLAAASGNTDDHPYAYARVVGIFHADFIYTGPESTDRTRIPQRMDFAWVRWFELDQQSAGGWDAQRMHRIKFATGSGAFGFLDPLDIIRAVHLIPAFAFGTTTDILDPSSARIQMDGAVDDSDWTFYYVNMFVDRDIFMRFLGGGVGHKATNAQTLLLRPSWLFSAWQANAADENDDNLDQLPIPSPDDTDNSDGEDESDGGGKATSNVLEDDDDDDAIDLGGVLYEGEDGEEFWDIDDIEAEGYGDY